MWISAVPVFPKLTGLENQEIHRSNLGWSPVYVEDNLAVMSIGFLLPNPDDAVIWRGPRKNGLIKQFLKVSPFSASAFPSMSCGWLLAGFLRSLDWSRSSRYLLMAAGCALGRA